MIIATYIFWGSEAARDVIDRSDETRTNVAKNETYLAAPPEISVYEAH